MRRDVWNGVVVTACPAVHADVGSYLRPGTVAKRARIPAKLDAPGAIEYRDHVWHSTHVLSLTPAPGDAHSTWVMWDETWNFVAWYVNLEAPHVRTPIGHDTLDFELDLVVWPDWRCERKDEQNFRRLVDIGRLTREQGELALEEAARMEKVIARRQPPFDEPWPDWRPDPAWALPTLPIGWQERA